MAKIEGALGIVALLVLGCSSGGSQTPGMGDLGMPPVTPDDLGGAAADLRQTPSDLLPAPDLRPPLDPASCPVGVSDGCCPLLRGGGSDPDCPKLDCAKLSQTAPVSLDPAGLGSGRGGSGQVAMAWTGTELALAWTYLTNDFTPVAKVLFERRNSAGDLIYGPVQREIPAGAAPATAGPTALAYEPTRKKYVFVHTATGLRYAVMGIDPTGSVTWGSSTGELCNAIWMGVDAYSTGAGWVIGQQNMTCAGSTYQPRIDQFDYDGMGQKTWWMGDGMHPTSTLNGAFAYNPASNQLLTIYSRWSEATLGARFLDLAKGTLLAGFTMRSGTPGYPFEHLGVVFDGKRYGVLFENRPSYSSFYQSFQIYDPAMGLVGSPLQFAGPRYILSPSMLWTGDGFLVAMMTFVGPDTPIGDLNKFTSMVYSFSPDGQLRESFAVDSGPAVYPKLMWAGGRVALTWVRVPATPGGGADTEHFLRYLSCP